VTAFLADGLVSSGSRPPRKPALGKSSGRMAHRHAGEDVVRQVCFSHHHAPRVARGADSKPSPEEVKKYSYPKSSYCVRAKPCGTMPQFRYLRNAWQAQDLRGATRQTSRPALASTYQISKMNINRLPMQRALRVARVKGLGLGNVHAAMKWVYRQTQTSVTL
jgi:hypothetical protein